jgi:alpha-2-macroglobulin
VPGVSARLFTDENEALGQAVTDPSGLAHLTANTNAEWIAVQLGDDFHAVSIPDRDLWSGGPSYWDSGERDDARRVMLFTDRNLYRPGEEVHLEALVRDWGRDGLTIPAGLTNRLQCMDARDRPFFQTNGAFSAAGSWSVTIPLPDTSRGAFTVRLLAGTNDYQHLFHVQDFQPNAFEVMLKSKPAFGAGEPIQVPVSANYLFGKPLSRAQVKWSIEAFDTAFDPEGYRGFRFSRDDFESHRWRHRSSATVQGQATLSASTNLVIAADLPMNHAAPQPRCGSLLVEVTDLNQQTVSRRTEFIRHSSEFYLGLKQNGEVLTASQKPRLEALALRADGTPWPEPVRAQLTLQRIHWESVRIQGAGRTIRYRNEAVVTNLLADEIVIPPLSSPAQPGEEAKGNPLTSLPDLPAGQYLVELKTTDAQQRPVVSSLCFQVSGPEQTSWNYRNDVQLTLKPDRQSYAPGDSAQILLEAPFGGTALVTIERERVLRSFTTRVDGNAPTIRVPIEPADAPNIFVAVTLLRGAQDCPREIKEPDYRRGSCELVVADPRTRLTVDVASAATNYLPSQEVAVTVRVNGHDGQPMPGAEVILYAVDEGILGLMDYSLPDAHGFFYAGRLLGVSSIVSLPNLLSEDPKELRFSNKGYVAGGGGMERLRKNFLACAFWNASLHTDAAGQATAKFPAPDSLTRYRLFAVAHTADSRFGGGQSAFQVSKPLILEPVLPRFANITDHVKARALVQNQTAQEGEVVVSLELDDKAKPDAADPVLTQRIRVSAQGSATVDFPVTFVETGEARWIWRAKFADPGVAGDFTDAVQSLLEVGHVTPLLREILLTRVSDAPTNLIAKANPQLLAGRGTLTIQVAGTRLNELGETASQLLHYPYCCAEQTGSSLLPWIVLRDAPSLLQLKEGVLATNAAAAAIRAGVARLFSMQTHSGGLGYWPHDKEPMLWASAYGGLVLAIAQRHGVEVPGHEFSLLLKYLSERMRALSPNSPDLPDACLALYALALAGHSEPAYHERLFALREKLTAEDRSLLALAVAEAQGPSAMIKELLQPSAVQRPTDEARFGCDARAKAILLLAWIHYRPADPIIDHLVEDLMQEQLHGHWISTQGNAWALLALTEYARRVEVEFQRTDGQLRWGDQSLTFHLEAKTNTFTRSFALSNLQGSPLILSSPSQRRLYSSVRIEAWPTEPRQSRQDMGFALQRRYERLDDDNQPRDLKGLRVGDRVLVTLRLTVRENRRYVAIDDTLPAILDAINPEFKTQEARAAGVSQDDSAWWPSDCRELRKDRCLSFANWVSPGTYSLRYVARVRAAGTVTAPAAKAEEMYHPDHHGLTESQIISSDALD